MTKRARLDAELVRRGLARSRVQAADLIAAGQVLVSGQAAAKAATQVAQDAAITVQQEDGAPGYVSRGGNKLAGALAAFRRLQVAAGTASTPAPRPAVSPTCCCGPEPCTSSPLTSATGSWPGACVPTRGSPSWTG